MSKKYEYKFVRVGKDLRDDTNHQEELFNHLGDQGWQMVSRDTHTAGTLDFWFVKEV